MNLFPQCAKIMLLLTVCCLTTGTANLFADTVGAPVSVSFPYAGVPAPIVNGNATGRSVSVSFPYAGVPAPVVNGNANGRPVSVSITAANTLDPDLVGLWHMDGDWGDTSGNYNGGVPINAPAFSTDKKIGTQSGSFNGSSSYLLVPDSTSLALPSTMTLEAWIKPSDVANYRQIISKFGSSGGYSYQLGLAPGGNLRIDVSGNGTTSDFLASTSAPISVNSWQHVAATFNAGLLKLYVNGVEVASKTSAVSSLKVVSTLLNIGSSPASIQYFYGLIDEAAMYKRALTAEEVAVHYANGITDPNAPAPPTINAVPSVVGANAVALSGTKPANTSVWVNGKKIAATDSTLTWQGSYTTLQPGLNILNITDVSFDTSYHQSAPVTQTLYYDNVSPAGTITINGGAALTGSTQIQLTLNATDADGMGQMRRVSR